MVARRIEDSLTAEERAEFSGQMAVFRRTLAWLDAHYDALVAAHPDHWVAVSSDGVLDVDSSFDKLAERVDQYAVRSGTIVVEYLPSKPLNLILSA